jgi:hypothetical protein
MKPITFILVIALLVLSACVTPSTKSPNVPALTADKLVIQAYELSSKPDSDSTSFKSVDGCAFTAADLEVGQPFPSKQVNDNIPLTLSVMLGSDTIVAEQVDSGNYILVTRNGKEIFRTDAGGISPMPPLQNLWAYDNHWILEINYFLADKPFNGQVFLDGVSIGQQNGYDEVFNFQTINGRPFYFFRHNGKVDAWFDGQVLPLGYDDVQHYVCCADSWLNPKAFQGAALFFGTKGKAWYFVRVGAPGVLP